MALFLDIAHLRHEIPYYSNETLKDIAKTIPENELKALSILLPIDNEKAQERLEFLKTHFYFARVMQSIAAGHRRM